ncbi:MAG: hypothetical protein QW650_00300 [Thermofilum sp.]
MKNLRFYPLTLEEVEGVDALAQLVIEAVLDQVEAGVEDWEVAVKNAEREVKRILAGSIFLLGLELLRVERREDETTIWVRVVAQEGERVVEVRAR